MKANLKLTFKMLFILTALICGANSTYAWTYTATGPWASFSFSDGWTVYQDGWGAPNDQSPVLYANSSGNFACYVNYTGGGVKNYCHTQKDSDIPISSSYYCTSSFNFSAPNNPWWCFFYDCWTANMQDELEILEGWNGEGVWGDLVASNVTIAGRTIREVRQANNGSNNVLIFTPSSQRTSGSDDIMAYFIWSLNRGLLHNSTLHQVSFGVEVTYTSGWQQFTVNSFSASWGQSGGCTPTTITPYIQVNNGSWQQTSSVTVNSGSTVKFGPQPVSGGSWSWTGCGTSGSSREQTITANSSCTATATYTNSSGCQSTQNFTVTVNGSGGGGSGYVKIQNKATGLYIDGMGRSSNGSNAGQWSNSSSSNQQWAMETSGSNVKFKNVATGLYLDGMGRNSNGSLAGQWSNSSSSNQQWTIETYGSYSRIKNVATGLYLDGMYWSSNGSDLGQWSSSGSDAQQWTITSLKGAEENSEEFSTVNEENGNVFLYPNPFTSGISLRIDNPEQVNSIVILDMLGKQVEVIDHAAVKNIQAIGSSLKAGMYVIQVCSSDKTQSFKILKK
jgi:hypothetical protein